VQLREEDLAEFGDAVDREPVGIPLTRLERPQTCKSPIRPEPFAGTVGTLYFPIEEGFYWDQSEGVPSWEDQFWRTYDWPQGGTDHPSNLQRIVAPNYQRSECVSRFRALATAIAWLAGWLAGWLIKQSGRQVNLRGLAATNLQLPFHGRFVDQQAAKSSAQ
jgi:hypothetical protein